MRFMPVKSNEQRAILSIHRIREGQIKERTALINQLRGLLSEFGFIMPKGRYSAPHHLPDILEDGENGLPMLARPLLHATWLCLRALNEQVRGYDRELYRLVCDSEPAKRLMTLPGIGEITTTAILAGVGGPRQFSNGRQFAAWLGLTPRQYMTGGKIRLGRITKQGDRLSCWTKALLERRGYKRAAVALAAKNAHILWAMMARNETYRLQTAD